MEEEANDGGGKNSGRAAASFKRLLVDFVGKTSANVVIIVLFIVSIVIARIRRRMFQRVERCSVFPATIFLQLSSSRNGTGPGSLEPLNLSRK